MQCPKCGVENGDKLKFCRACGGALAATMPAAPAPLAATEALPVVTPAPPPPAPPPPPPPPAAPVPAPVYAPPPAPPAPRNNTPVIIGVAIALGLLLLALVAIAGIAAWTTLGQRVSTTVATATKDLPSKPETTGPSGSDTGGSSAAGADDQQAAADKESEKPQAEPVPSTDPVAEATVVLEKYLAADLGHDGQEMQKYLGGQARARFNPDVVGQEDVTVHSKTIDDHTVKDDNTINFMVKVEWTPADSDNRKIMVQQYVLKRTDEGWLITSTPEYPE